MSLNDLARMIGDETGANLEPEHRAPRAGDVRDSLADIEAARALLGYEPTVRVREGLRRTIEAFRGFTPAA